MRIDELKQFFYDTVSDFYPNATVVWSGEISERPKLPFLVLRIGTVRKGKFPIDTCMDDELGYVETYEANVPFEIKGYCRGHIQDETMVQTADNTSMEDLQQFVDYMDSPYGSTLQVNKDVCFDILNPVTDTSVATQSSKYEYSAMVEYQVNFEMQTAGNKGLSQVTKKIKNHMGADTNMDEPMDYFDSVDDIESNLE